MQHGEGENKQASLAPGMLYTLRKSRIVCFNLHRSKGKKRGSRKGTSGLDCAEFRKTIKWSLTQSIQFMVTFQQTLLEGWAYSIFDGKYLITDLHLVTSVCLLLSCVLWNYLCMHTGWCVLYNTLGVDIVATSILRFGKPGHRSYETRSRWHVRTVKLNFKLWFGFRVYLVT